VNASPYRRARRAFWGFAVLSVLLAGALSRVLHAAPGAATGITVLVLGALLTVSVALTARLLLALAGRLPAPRPPSRPGD